MLHGQNPTHTTKQCRTLRKEAVKHRKSCKNGDRKNKERRCNPSKDEIHALAAFSKEKLKAQCKNVDKELKNFQNMSISGDEVDK